MRNLHESRLQTNCVRWFDYSYPKLKLNLFSIPNEGARTIANGARMKAQGRRAGTADMFLAVPNHTFPLIKEILCNGLFIEFKHGNAKQSESQESFQRAVQLEEYRYEVITDFDQFKNLIESYLL